MSHGLLMIVCCIPIGVFVTRAALQGDRRLVLAGLPARETLLARAIVLAAATLVAVAVSAMMLALAFTPASWAPVITALVLTGLIYAAIGTLIGGVLDKLPASYLILFLVMTDLGVVQSPMFHATPTRFSWLLPGYPLERLL
jgi:hypothetical protein